MSYNVKCSNDILRNKVDGSVKTRSKYVINNILFYMPHSVGFQEVIKSKNKKAISWHKLLTEGLKDYYNCNTTERNHIFYNKNKLDLIDQETKWLSPTPDIPYTQFPKPSDGLTRTLSYAILKNKITGFCYLHINIHLDYKIKQKTIRQIKVVANFISKYKNNYPILLTGDFNSKKIKGEAVFYLLEHGYYDSADEAQDSFRYWTYPAIGYQKNI